jgi:hypothetical protein
MNYKIDDLEIEDWPENPMETVLAYLKWKYPDTTVWITKTETTSEQNTKMSWYKSDGHGNPVGEPCATITY